MVLLLILAGMPTSKRKIIGLSNDVMAITYFKTS